MKLDEAKYIQNLMENAGEECDIREEYSARGMYGKTTVGIVVDSELLLIQILLQYIRDISADPASIDNAPNFGSLRHDNMGAQIILY